MPPPRFELRRILPPPQEEVRPDARSKCGCPTLWVDLIGLGGPGLAPGLMHVVGRNPCPEGVAKRGFDILLMYGQKTNSQIETPVVSTRCTYMFSNPPVGQAPEGPELKDMCQDPMRPLTYLLDTVQRHTLDHSKILWVPS